MRRWLSLVLMIMMIGACTMKTDALDNATIEYRFAGVHMASAGYAEGTVTLHAVPGEYDLYWADEQGALDGYYAITRLTVVAGGEGVYTFAERVAIPVGATRLLALRAGAEEPTAVYTLPDYKRLDYTHDDRHYRFAAMSDIHIDEQDGGTNAYYINAAANFAQALRVCHDRAADFIVAAGDQVTNASGAALEWMTYQRLISDSPYDGDIYEAIGNHELRYAKYSGCDVSCGIDEFITATGLEGDKPYYELIEPHTGDHFIFMALEYNVDPSLYDEFSEEQLQWAERLLDRYDGDGHRVFLIQHSPISGYGAGDDLRAPAYGGSMYADSRFPANLRFRQMLEAHRDVIWLSGHTHVDFRDDVNFSDEGGASCLMFHIPSVANTTRITTDENGANTLDRTFYPDTSQCYFVDVYGEAVVLCGTNLYDNRIYPAYTYIVGETPQGAPAVPVKPTETTEPVETTTPAVPYVYGDADLDGELTIFDAAAIQRHLADMERLSDPAIQRCLLSGYDELTIFDVTLIQRRLAGMIDFFDIEKGPAATASGDLEVVVRQELSTCFQYASYPAYAALRRACRSGDSRLMEEALTAFRALRDRVRITTVYFSDNRNMGDVRAYLWNNATGRYIDAWPGQRPTYVRTNSLDERVYAVTVDTARYDRAVFHSGDSQKTVDIPLTGQSGRVYYPISSDSPYRVSYSVYNRMWSYAADQTATVYFTNTQDWSSVYLYSWTNTPDAAWPGTEMTYVRRSSTGKGIYMATVPADSKVIFTDGSRQTVDIPCVADGFGYYLYQKDDKNKWMIVEYKY